MVPVDKATIAELIEGSQAAFNNIFVRYSPRILSLGKQFLGSQELGRDLVQEVFTKIWTGREKLRGVENFEVYLWVVARNAALTLRRQMATEQQHHEEYLRTHGLVYNNVDKYMNARDYNRIVNAALEAETPKRQLIYKLSREKGLSPKEIASQLHMSNQTVKNEITLILKRIRGRLEGHLISVLLLASLDLFP